MMNDDIYLYTIQNKNNSMMESNEIRQKESIAQQNIPLYFTNPSVDKVAKLLTTFGNIQVERIIYLGPRFVSNQKAFMQYGYDGMGQQRQWIENPQIFNEKKIRRFGYRSRNKERYVPNRASEYRLFTGINPTSKDDLHFDSSFQCGNLDLVVSKHENQYDLFLRVDSNTRGHNCWFFFSIKNFKSNQRVKFNILNFAKSELMYDSGMKIYVFRSSTEEWRQQGQKLSFSRSQNPTYIGNPEQNDQYYNRVFKLSFEYVFKKEDNCVYFSYCIPYSYSLMIHKIEQWQEQNQNFLTVNYENYSMGNNCVPVMTVNQGEDFGGSAGNGEKPTCLVIGRLHPGESQSNWVLQGFIDYLCSNKGKQLRKKMIFKIIPMVNVDGVVLGNFRTNLMGRDLNRMFHKLTSFKEVELIKSIAKAQKPLFFLDFHGHSAKKNIFVYGPDYSIDDRYFLPSRLFPKLISKESQAFRYYSCSFRIPENKSNTGRSIMLRQFGVRFPFTIETSSHAYGRKSEQKVFTISSLIKSGESICISLNNFLNIIFSPPRNTQSRLHPLTQQPKHTLKSTQKQTRIASDVSQIYPLNMNNLQNNQIVLELMKDQKAFLHANQHGNNKDDKYDSDCQEGDDYSNRQLRKLMKDEELGGKQVQGSKVLVVSRREHLKTDIVMPQVVSNSKMYFIESYKTKKAKYLKQFQSIKSINHNIVGDSSRFKSLQGEEHIIFSKIKNNNKKSIENQRYEVGMNKYSPNIQNFGNQGLQNALKKISSHYQPLSSIKVKENPILFTKRKMDNAEDERRRLKRKEKEGKESLIVVKKMFLPSLGISGNLSQQQKRNLIDQMLQNHERTNPHHQKKPKKNLFN